MDNVWGGDWGWFQSLTGSIHTSEKKSKREMSYYVSIPHRFNSHIDASSFLFTSNFRFNPSQVQFTHAEYFKNKFKINKFQSLTGSIHTPIPKTTNLIQFLFQSLTGSIHTFIMDYLGIGSASVSIPHRFNSHNLWCD